MTVDTKGSPLARSVHSLFRRDSDALLRCIHRCGICPNQTQKKPQISTCNVEVECFFFFFFSPISLLQAFSLPSSPCNSSCLFYSISNDLIHVVSMLPLYLIKVKYTSQLLDTHTDTHARAWTDMLKSLWKRSKISRKCVYRVIEYGGLHTSIRSTPRFFFS